MRYRSKETYSSPTASLSLRALDSVHRYVLVQETRTLLDESEGVQRSTVDTSTPKHLRRVPVSMKRLKGVSGQITEIRGWLRTHPDLLLVFDEALHREFRG